MTSTSLVCVCVRASVQSGLCSLKQTHQESSVRSVLLPACTPLNTYMDLARFYAPKDRGCDFCSKTCDFALCGLKTQRFCCDCASFWSAGLRKMLQVYGWNGVKTTRISGSHVALVPPYCAILRYYCCDTFSGRSAAPQDAAIPPLLYLAFTDTSVRYPILQHIAR